MSSGSRIYYLDLVKVLAMFLVVYGHLFTGDSATDLYIYGFHLPCFFLVSGVFYKFTGKIRWKKYAVDLLWPTVIFIVINFLFRLLHGFVAPEGQGLTEAVDFVKAQILGLAYGRGIGVYWFLIALFWTRIFCDITMVSRHKWIPVSVWIVMLLVPHVMKIHLPLLLSNGLMGLPFYMVGACGKDTLRSLKCDWRYLIPFVICLVGTFLLSKLNGKVSMVGVYFGSHGALSIPLFYLNGLVGSMMLMSLSLLPFKDFPVVTRIALSLITIVGIQEIFIMIYSDIFGRNNGFPLSFVSACVILLLCHLAHRFLSPLYNWDKIRSLAKE